MRELDLRSPLPAPDFADTGALLAWLAAGRATLAGLTPTPALEASIEPLEYLPSGELGPLGRFADARFRTLVAATFLADLASYPAPVDQVDFERLLYVMHRFPQGFRMWSAEVPGAGRLPVGYSGFYPIARTSFTLLEQEPATLRDRMVVPLPSLEPGGSFLYLFNFSVVPALKRTSVSRRLLQALAGDIARAAPRGLSSITVSPDGARVVTRFGLKQTGTLVVDGCEEAVFTWKGED
ncbi:MAG: hypothetical protein U0359_24200 [Byssovorax sp.]